MLQDNIDQLVSAGYRVVSQTDTTAQLVKPKSFSFAFWFILCLLVAAILGVYGFVGALVTAVLLYLAEKDSQVYLALQSDGRVTRTITGPPVTAALVPSPEIKQHEERAASGWVCSQCGYKLLYTDSACPKCQSEQRKWKGA